MEEFRGFGEDILVDLQFYLGVVVGGDDGYQGVGEAAWGGLVGMFETHLLVMRVLCARIEIMCII